MVRILEKYSWHLLSKDLSYLGPVDWFEVGAKLTTNINTEVTDTATVECPRVPMLDGGPVDWNRVFVQARYERPREGLSGAIGTYRARVTGRELGVLPTRPDLSLYDRTLALVEKELTASFSVASGTPIVPLIGSLIVECGETTGPLPDDPVVTRIETVWEPGTKYLRVVNDLLSSAGYFALATYRDGRFKIERNPGVDYRPIVWNFDTSVPVSHTPGVSQKISSVVPNEIICTTQASGEKAALIAVARNTDPLDPNSIPFTGRTISKSYTNLQMATQEALQAYASQMLALNSNTRGVNTRTLIHPRIMSAQGWMPVHGNDVVAQDGRREVVENIDIVMTPGATMKLVSREAGGGV